MMRKMLCLNSVFLLLLAGFFLLYPPLRAALDVYDPALQKPGIPRAAWRLYKTLTPRYALWAQRRMAAGRAQSLSTENISGTEWPLFGSVFYLWSLENLQAAWQGGDHSSGLEPKVFAREAIVAASELVIDPGHAAWVQTHWGSHYLHRENVFYRMLVIGALTSRQNLLHDNAHLDLLCDQVETLSQELDRSRQGLLDDYPGQCYPADVMAALMCIQRADAVLGTDHSRFLNRALRAFIGPCSTPLQLPPYMANADSAVPATESRGCANSYLCLTAPELWPQAARRWYGFHERFFWQQRLGAGGFREFANTDHPLRNWSMDVDASPVIAGYGVSASAFGLGAARKNGRFDHAFPLAAEMLATVFELPDGTLLVPRLLSNLSDAPYLGEAGILWQLSIQPQKGFALKSATGSIPLYTYVLLAGTLLVGGGVLLRALCLLRQGLRGPEPLAWAAPVQFGLWVLLLLASLGAFLGGQVPLGFLALLLALVFPLRKKRPAPHAFADWPEARAAEDKAQHPLAEGESSGPAPAP